jgi:hypothetical protein
MSSTIDQYKISGLALINIAQRYIDIDPIQNDISSIGKPFIFSIHFSYFFFHSDKSWSEYVEYILDTLDYIQLHQEDLREFYQLANHLLTLLNEKLTHFETINENEIEKIYEQVELVNQKGELLLQSSASDSNENQVEHLLETINRNYDHLSSKTKARLDNIDHTTIDELRHHINEIDSSMNELSELIVSSTTDIISAQPIKLTEQLVDNTVVQNELEKRKLTLEQLHSDIQKITNQDDRNSIKDLNEKLTLLTEHWFIMKQANDLCEENLLLTQSCANSFWSEYNELSLFLNNISQQLSQIHPRSTSREYIEHEQEKFNRLMNEFSTKQIKFQELLQKHSLQLLTLISTNQQETEDIQRYVNELEQEWNRIQTDLSICQTELSEAMMKSVDFNAKLESVSTWFDDASSLPTTIEHIRTFKEHLDNKYIDIVNLKQDYTDIEQQNEYITEEKTNLVEEQLVEIDSKWTQLNDKIQEQ